MSSVSLQSGRTVAAISGVVLFVDMFLSWYGVSISLPGGLSIGGLGIDTTADAWQAFGSIDLVLFITAVVAVAGEVLARLNHPLASNPMLVQAALWLGLVSVLLVAYRIIDQPGPNKLIDVRYGAYIGLIAAAGVAYGAWRTTQESPGGPPLA